MKRLLQHLVAENAQRRPDAPAVVFRGESTSYGQLEAWSNRLARVLKEHGCARGDRVGLLMPKSTTAVASILAIYKADCILVPLDPAGPASRLEKIIRSCGCGTIVASGPVMDLVAELRGSRALSGELSLGWLGTPEEIDGRLAATFTGDDVERQSDEAPGCSNAPHDPAHILYTSGSTGEPKGVIIQHANVLAFVDWARRRYGFGPADRFSGHSPLHFDLSTFDLFGAFASGASLHLVPPEVNLQPSRLAKFIRDSELTEWLSVPSVLNYMSQTDVVAQDDFPTLRRLFWCGEVFPTPALIHWMSRLPHVSFTNLYGPTEATIASSYYDVPRCPDDERAAIPIGEPCDGEELLILDEQRRPLPPGEVGDLYIRGVGVSPGYWNDPERTRAAFFTDPERFGGDRIYKTGDVARVGDDGLFYMLGRSDSQIKSRGYRIELDEIEKAVNALGLSEETVVTAIETDGYEGKLICCAFVPGEKHVTPAVLKRKLRSLLPSYMIPVRWMSVPRLPRNGSGKVDRRRLRDRFADNEAAPVGRRAVV